MSREHLIDVLIPTYERPGALLIPSGAYRQELATTLPAPEVDGPIALRVH